ncbi:hypothetical protein KIN20_032504 [Parelaphostrongylus tenuis]|uniref:Uncharacterized protein n=1 Tax=Parelaphostrongylus tenuis TaxID=148309 RepID=A0AAD5WHJ7_PARTN|nr:hypothetical protein KIN20_032504 [Parelaphostrongylus tenuis]
MAIKLSSGSHKITTTASTSQNSVRDPKTQIPQQQPPEVQTGISGYNSHYPEMHGVFLAYGPSYGKDVYQEKSSEFLILIRNGS